MAYEVPVGPYTLTAGADLRTAQFTFVKMSADNTVVQCSAATDIPVGILQNTPNTGDAASILSLGVSKLVGNAGIAAGAQVGTSNAGKGVALVAGTDTSKYVVGQVLQGTSNANELLSVLLNCATPHRAA